METRARYALIGLFMLAVLVASFGFVYWLESAGGFGERQTYRIRFQSSVSGLLVGSAVLFNGIKEGEVTALALDPADPAQVTATIAVEPATPVRADTEVNVEFQGLTGGAAVALKGGSADAPALAANDGETPLLIAPVTAGQDWSTLARQVLRRLDTILADNADPVKSVIGNLDTFAQVLARNSDRIDAILAGLERMTAGAAAKAALPIYDLLAPAGFPSVAEPPRWQLVIPEPSTLLAFNTDKIMLAPAKGETTTMPNAQWADNLPVLFQEKVLQGFENAGLSSNVGRPRDGFTPDYQLVLDIRRFQVATSASPVAEIAFVAKVLGGDGKIVAARTFEATAPAATTDPSAAAAALNEAFGKGARELVLWASEAVGKAAAHPPSHASPGGPGRPSPSSGSPGDSSGDPAAGPSGL
jgi:phospholipid/cholesterol/gamma-HCH transport system substrate-binding protein